MFARILLSYTNCTHACYSMASCGISALPEGVLLSICRCAIFATMLSHFANSQMYGVHQ